MVKVMIGLTFTLFSCFVKAHSLEPTYITVAESVTGYRVTLAMPDQFAEEHWPLVTFPEACQWHSISEELADVECSEAIVGQNIKVNYPNAQPTGPTMIFYESLEGSSQLDELPSSMEWRVPEQPSAMTVYKRYIVLGFEHILAGFDHLLFVLCLLMLAKGTRKTVLIISGFTVAHSVTLILTAYNFVSLPVNAVEVAIALSLFMLVLEVASSDKETLTHRYPFAVSSLFGLLHGLGFASVLMNLGLPEAHRFVGLLFFNVGVELAQLTIVIGWMLVSFAMNKTGVDEDNLAQHRTLALTAIGSLSVYWLISRTLYWLV